MTANNTANSPAKEFLKLRLNLETFCIIIIIIIIIIITQRKFYE